MTNGMHTEQTEESQRVIIAGILWGEKKMLRVVITRWDLYGGRFGLEREFYVREIPSSNCENFYGF